MPTSDPLPELLIEVYSDPICPWCWVGHARLEGFLRSDEFQSQIAPHVRTAVKFRPYLLDTRLPATSFPTPERFYEKASRTEFEEFKPPTKREYYSKKFAGGLDAFDERISRAAEESGLAGFRWLTEGKVGATWLAHRLIWKAGEKSGSSVVVKGGEEGLEYIPTLQSRLVERLYEDYHANSSDLSDVEYLSSVAEQVGVFDDENQANEFLRGEEGEEEVGQKLEVAEMNGIRSIPFYIVNEGEDHMSEVGSHASFLKMMQMAVAPYVR
ncbi:hypothetical protein IE53DRAFT_387349 [Violaceomyces palustris]|uniref:Uncharacterized protein n=1 Tax=Violaceomyces palustris TaxID=1673888 RepID=A0ACD0NWZ0_9BASI|nr:hypothetical protein IE53DRAFT_387349 [Violaceomyces palustris]